MQNHSAKHQPGGAGCAGRLAPGTAPQFHRQAARALVALSRVHDVCCAGDAREDDAKTVMLCWCSRFTSGGPPGGECGHAGGSLMGLSGHALASLAVTSRRLGRAPCRLVTCRRRKHLAHLLPPKRRTRRARRSGGRASTGGEDGRESRSPPRSPPSSRPGGAAYIYLANTRRSSAR